MDDIDKDKQEFKDMMEESLEQLGNLLPSILSKLLGRRIPNGIADKISEIRNMIPEISELLGKYPGIENSNKSEQLLAISNLLNDLVRIVVPDMPTDKTGIEYIAEFLDTRKPLPDGSYLIETAYIKYTDAVSDIAYEIVSTNSWKEIQAYLDSVFNYHDDVMSGGQMLMINFPLIHKELQKGRKYFTKKQAQNDIEIYDKLAGQFEKCIAVAAGIINIINGQVADYPRIRQRKLASNLDKVAKSKYSILTAGFEKIMRNALAHKTCFVNPLDRNVRFYDPISNESLTLSYKEIHKKTKELSALVIVLYRLPQMIQVEMLRKFDNSIKCLKGTTISCSNS
jgi:hypothetical protein